MARRAMPRSHDALAGFERRQSRAALAEVWRTFGPVGMGGIPKAGPLGYRLRRRRRTGTGLDRSAEIQGFNRIPLVENVALRPNMHPPRERGEGQLPLGRCGARWAIPILSKNPARIARILTATHRACCALEATAPFSSGPPVWLRDAAFTLKAIPIIPEISSCRIRYSSENVAIRPEIRWDRLGVPAESTPRFPSGPRVRLRDAAFTLTPIPRIPEIPSCRTRMRVGKRNNSSRNSPGPAGRADGIDGALPSRAAGVVARRWIHSEDDSHNSRNSSRVAPPSRSRLRPPQSGS